MKSEEAKVYLENLMEEKRVAGKIQEERELCEALSMAIGALRKQTPKKKSEKSCFAKHCPRCNEYLDDCGFEVRYCFNCGQRVID